MAYDKRKMQDIAISEKPLLAQYLQLWRNQDINGINTLLTNNPSLKYKIFNAENWNRILNLINDSQGSDPATTDSLVGTWQDIYQQLQTASANFVLHPSLWMTGVIYEPNNLVQFTMYDSYFCIKEHESSLENAPPNSEYWIQAFYSVDPSGMPVSATSPSGLNVGEVYFKEI